MYSKEKENKVAALIMPKAKIRSPRPKIDSLL
jgi:hypothetical protein